MITFKQFLAEAAVDNEPEWEIKSAEEAIELIRKHCSDAEWMCSSNTPIWRADTKGGTILRSNHFAVVDPSKTVRMSQNTSNWYTEIFDNHPEMTDFPKRSRSFIGTTDYSYATAFTGLGHVPVVLIPYNDVKIGVVGEEDLWDIRLDLWGKPRRLEGVNSTLTGILFNTDLKLPKTWESLVKFDRLMRYDSLPQDIIDQVMYEAGSIPINFKTFLSDIITAYSPKKTGLTFGTTASLRPNASFTHGCEVWVGGPCVAISKTTWEIIHRELFNEE